MLGLIMNKLPRNIIFGAGEMQNLGKYAADLGSRAFVVMDQFLHGSWVAKGMLDNLHRCGVKSVEFYDVSSNPRNTVVDDASALCQEENCDMVIAVGGGSSIDTAKIVSVITKNGGKSWDCINQPELSFPNGALPLIAIPTTSGSGSESTNIAVITNRELNIKRGFSHELLLPALVILDPELTVSMPPSLTAYTGIDAFAHCFESLLVANSNSFSEAVAYEGIHLFAESIEECVKNGSNLVARSKMAICSTFGGMAITSGGTTWPHGIGQTLSGKFDMLHGVSLACCLSEVIRATLPAAEDICARVARIFEPMLAVLSLSKQAAKLPDVLDKLFSRILPKRVRLSDYGLNRETVPELVELLFQSGNGYGQRVHPKKFEKQDIEKIVVACL
jgi:alcohol dehydrogenase class IV